jgi:hypothetical protein
MLVKGSPGRVFGMLCLSGEKNTSQLLKVQSAYSRYFPLKAMVGSNEPTAHYSGRKLFDHPKHHGIFHTGGGWGVSQRIVATWSGVELGCTGMGQTSLGILPPLLITVLHLSGSTLSMSLI